MINYAHVHDEAVGVGFDALSTYDNEFIGREFAAVQPTLNEYREHELRRAQLAVSNWKEISAMSDSQRIPKSSLKNVCRYDTQRAYTQSVATFFVYMICTSLAGAMIAFIIKNLAM